MDWRKKYKDETGKNPIIKGEANICPPCHISYEYFTKDYVEFLEQSPERVSVDAVVMRACWWIKHTPYRLKWKIVDLYERWYVLRGFTRWMEKRQGYPNYSIAFSMNWRRNTDGILISLFRRTNILKVYHESGKKTVNFDLTKKQDRIKAKEHIQNA